jgi:hypothetical protein
VPQPLRSPDHPDAACTPAARPPLLSTRCRRAKERVSDSSAGQSLFAATCAWLKTAQTGELIRKWRPPASCRAGESSMLDSYGVASSCAACEAGMFSAGGGRECTECPPGRDARAQRLASLCSCVKTRNLRSMWQGFSQPLHGSLSASSALALAITTQKPPVRAPAKLVRRTPGRWANTRSARQGACAKSVRGPKVAVRPHCPREFLL